MNVSAKRPSAADDSTAPKSTLRVIVDADDHRRFTGRITETEYLGSARRPRRVPRSRRSAPSTRTPRIAGGCGWGWRPSPATSGGRHRVVRGPRLRDPLSDAARTGAPPLSPCDLPAIGSTGLRRSVGRGDGDPARLTRHGRELGLGRGVPRCHHRESRSVRDRSEDQRRCCYRSVVLGRHRRHAAVGQDRNRVRKARWRGQADAARVDPDDGSKVCHCDLGYRLAYGGAPR